jgi:hypothetical protein
MRSLLNFDFALLQKKDVSRFAVLLIDDLAFSHSDHLQKFHNAFQHLVRQLPNIFSTQAKQACFRSRLNEVSSLRWKLKSSQCITLLMSATSSSVGSTAMAV